MMKPTIAVAMLIGGVLSAPDIAGEWQGTLKPGKTGVRVVISIAKVGKSTGAGGSTR